MKNNLFFPAIAFIVLTSLILIHIYFGILPFRWKLSLPFADLIGITGAAECLKKGLDPYIVTTFDPFGRTFNYPKIWLTVFNFFNLDSRTTVYLGLSLAYVFILLTSFIFKIFKRFQLLFVLLLLFSPPILLLLERGNSDIVIYLLLLFSVFFLRRLNGKSQTIRLHLSYIIILIAIILKIYPAILIVLLLFENISKRNLVIILVYSFVFLAVYGIYTYKDILFISKNTPEPNDIAYGKNVLLQLYFGGKKLMLISNAFILLIFSAALYFCSKFKNQLNETIPITYKTKENIFLFLTGSLIYSGTFLIGNNWDYRLSFLLFTIPYFLAFNNKYKIVSISISTLFLSIFYSAYLAEFFAYKYFYVLKVLSSWGLLFIIFIVIIHLLRNRERLYTV